jgi:cytochrome c-type biogenesis protein
VQQDFFHRQKRQTKMAAFDPSALGIFLFGLIAGICPCNSVLCMGLIRYLTSGETQLSLRNILKLTISFCIGTILILLPLGVIAG